MGVPAFFRWLSQKYPNVIIKCDERKVYDWTTHKFIYQDPMHPNPNGIEFDNLYLDMNGIIHSCTHPEDKPAPENENEMILAIFECVDRLFGIIRPRKLLYMAIDGVAPRAKMNQQRSRRFKAAKESVENRLALETKREELLEKGCILPPQDADEEHFDSNCITPGTTFMDRLSKCLHYYIHNRMNNNRAWKGIKVILSDANVPGEGEHKIMDYIRKQRLQPDHDPNTRHVLFGADADLIMLGLATHEPNFMILREEFLPYKPKPCCICKQYGHKMDSCMGITGMHPLGSNDEQSPGDEVKYIFVRLSVLREYLKRTLEMPNLPFLYNFERAVDDWVFMCFFVGNDFLPHLPSLEIREGAIDRLTDIYKQCIYQTEGYLTNSGEVNLDRLQMLLTKLGGVEDQVFIERHRNEEQIKAREKSQRMLDREYNVRNMQFSDVCSPLTLEAQSDYEESEDDNDEVRLHKDGFKDRYYESKFDIDPNNIHFRYCLALQYVRGLCWVLKYYYQGCASWDWYFPYHYAPFASDIINITGLSTAFERGTKPFRPLEQLMGVLPASSSAHVPQSWATLMSDPESPIIDFYPSDFKIDLNGKKFAWQGVALLPFVDKKRLYKALTSYYEKLTDEEIRRNKPGDSRLYIGKFNPHFEKLRHHLNVLKTEENEVSVVLDGMRGSILKADNNISLGKNVKSTVQNLEDIFSNKVITFRFKDPQYPATFIFPAVRLLNAIDPPNVLGPQRFNTDLPPGYLSAAGHRGGPGNQYYQSGSQLYRLGVPNVLTNATLSSEWSTKGPMNDHGGNFI